MWFLNCPSFTEVYDPGFRKLPGLADSYRDETHPGILEIIRKKLSEYIQKKLFEGYSCCFFFDTIGTLQNLRKFFKEIPDSNFSVSSTPLLCGFENIYAKLIVVSESDILGKRRFSYERYEPFQLKTKQPYSTAEKIDVLDEMEPGDLIVHIHHGIGKYLGITEITSNNTKQEVIAIEYADGAKLYVPVSQSHLLSRYIGLPSHKVELHKLGTSRWQREKKAAENSIMDLAATLLETQAQREILHGFAYPQDTPWQKEFEASFPFMETPDQSQAIEEIKRDMESSKPMDRLLCGDAGFGKTEVAMRAAFKAAMSNKQTAVLVPTTILAQQHYQTFTERMRPYPIRIEMLSRFVSKRKNKQLREELAEGKIDIIIGTHALLRPDIKFKDLGLVIIDEEQRFGVEHKEKLKQIRKLVDVLTMTATPIPRTLYLSMTGSRDISLIQTPPINRLPVETIIAKYSDNLIREAILRELNREGQIFYLYNRVVTIEAMYNHLKHIVPEAHIAVAHGQMPPTHLEETMRKFVQREYNLLISTTIIENGLDIPNVNTIIIDRADRFGIADLYQLRGRVGRSSVKAYAYLLLPSHGHINPEAEEKIRALKRYSELGSGFNLALKDLEIRGAGNLLGKEQSGHIAAVGFGLYCQLLRQSIAKLKGEKPPPIIKTEINIDFIQYSTTADEKKSATIPIEYIENEEERLIQYRKIAEILDMKALAHFSKNLRDRYGNIPPPLERLLKIVKIRIIASNTGISKIETKDNKIIITRNNAYVKDGKGKFPRLTNDSCDKKLDQIIHLLEKLPRMHIQ